MRKGEIEKSIENFEKFLELAPQAPEAERVDALVEDLKKKKSNHNNEQIAISQALIVRSHISGERSCLLNHLCRYGRILPATSSGEDCFLQVNKAKQLQKMVSHKRKKPTPFH